MYTPLFAKNNANGIVVSDNTSYITFDAGHTLPTDVSSGQFRLTIENEIMTVTDVSGNDYYVTRAQEDTVEATHAPDVTGHLNFTASYINLPNTQLELNTTKLDYLTVTQAVDLDTLESNVLTNNSKVSYTDASKVALIDVTGSIDLDVLSAAVDVNSAKVSNVTHTGEVTGSTALTIDPTAISGKTEVTPVSTDFLLIWDATDSTLKKVDASNFLTIYGDTTGAASSTDDAIVRFNGTSGKLIQNSGVTINDSNSITGITTLFTSGTVTVGNSSTASSTYLDINTNASQRKGVRYQDAGTVVWIHQHDTDDNFKLLRYVGGVFQGYPLWINNSNGNIYFSGAVDITGNLTLSGTVDGRDVAADGTKLDYITVTQAVDLDTLESDVATNTAKVSNATHTGEVTGSTALTIDPTAISGKTTVTAVTGDYVLLWDATDSQLKKANVSDFGGGGGISNVIEDTTPQLGGMLDVNGNSLGDGTLELLSFSETGSAVNEFTIANAATGNGPILSATGDDTNVDMTFTPKGTGVVHVSSALYVGSDLDVTGGLTVTGQARHSSQASLSTTGAVSWDIDANPKVSLNPTGNVTLTINNILQNSEGTIYFVQDAATAYTVTWPGTVNWVNNSEPDLSTLSSEHIISFYSYDGTNVIAASITTQTSATFISGPASSTDTAIAIFDGTSGSNLANSVVTIDVSGNMAGVGTISGYDLSTFVTADSSTSLTNKEIQPRVASATVDTTSVTFNVDNGDIFDGTLTGNSTLNNPTGTPYDGQKILLRLRTGAGGFTLAYGTSFRFSTDLPSPTITTTASKLIYMFFEYNSTDSKYDLLSMNEGF